MRKWYMKDNGATILHGFPDDVSRHHPEAKEIPECPSSEYVWNQEKNEWVFDFARMKRIRSFYVQKEYSRLEKFERLPDQIKTSIEPELILYKESLRQYIKTFSQESQLPEVPKNLTDENFYSL